jgi:ATP-dependent Clp protease ATP-binding subunit ClpC
VVVLFEKFTDQARRAVVLASDAARTHHHDHLGTEHLLLGVLEADGVAATSLTSWGISTDVIAEIGPREPDPAAHIPFTPHAKKVLEQSLRETSLLGHDDIGTEHLLLALIDNRSSAGAQILDEAGPASLDRLREHVLRQVAEDRHEPAGPGPTHITTVRLTDAEHTLCADAAAEAGQRLDRWMRDRILDAARTRRPTRQTDTE